MTEALASSGHGSPCGQAVASRKVTADDRRPGGIDAGIEAFVEELERRLDAHAAGRDA